MFRDHIAASCARAPSNKGTPLEVQVNRTPKAGFGFGSLFSLGEMLGERLLALPQNADAEAAVRFQEGKKTGIVIHADEDEQRVQRNRGEGVGGHAVNLAGFAFDGDDGDAGGEGAGDAAKQHGIES